MPALRPSHLIVAHCLTAVLASACPGWAQSGSPPHQGLHSKVVEFTELRSPSPRRIAVVGDVERPGVYESTTRVTAGSLLTASGSLASAGDYLTRFHSGMLPVITPTWDAESAPLVDGDVIVVSISPSRRDRKAPDHIHVAVLGLGRDPVVIRVPKFDQTLPGLFSLLRQPSDAVAGATVNGAKSVDLLKNGDVIVVSSHLIDRAGVVGCQAILPITSLDPPPETSQATTGGSPPANVPSEPEFPELNAPSPGEQNPPAAAVAAAPTITPPAEETWTVASLEPVAPAAEPLPAKAVARAEETADNPRPAPSAARRNRVRTADSETAAIPDGNAKVRNLVICVALGTLGLGVALLWLASEWRLRTVKTPEPVALTPSPPEPEVAARDELGELIRGELPIEDEPVVLPARIALHGQAIGQKRLVVHPPQGLAGPHFGSAASTPEKVAAVNESGPSRTSPVRPVPPASPIRSAKDAEGLLDRVLLAMQREGRR